MEIYDQHCPPWQQCTDVILFYQERMQELAFYCSLKSFQSSRCYQTLPNWENRFEINTFLWLSISTGLTKSSFLFSADVWRSFSKRYRDHFETINCWYLRLRLCTLLSNRIFISLKVLKWWRHLPRIKKWIKYIHVLNCLKVCRMFAYIVDEF